jgi:hypothetical protein
MVAINTVKIFNTNKFVFFLHVIMLRSSENEYVVNDITHEIQE